MTLKSIVGDFKNFLEARSRLKSVAGDILISGRPFHSGIPGTDCKMLMILNQRTDKFYEPW